MFRVQGETSQAAICLAHWETTAQFCHSVAGPLARHAAAACDVSVCLRRSLADMSDVESLSRPYSLGPQIGHCHFLEIKWLGFGGGPLSAKRQIAWLAPEALTVIGIYKGMPARSIYLNYLQLRVLSSEVWQKPLLESPAQQHSVSLLTAVCKQCSEAASTTIYLAPRELPDHLQTLSVSLVHCQTPRRDMSTSTFSSQAA